MTQQYLKVINPYNFSIRNWERLPREDLLTVENTKHKSNSGGNIPRREGVKVYTKRCSPTLRGIVVLVFTKSVETLVGTLFKIYKHFWDSVESIFTILLQIQHGNIFLPTSKHRQATASRFLGIYWYDCRIYSSNFVYRKMSQSEAPSWLRSQKTVNSHGYSE